MEALALPVLLCTVDSRLGLSLRRSLRCNKSRSKQLHSNCGSSATASAFKAAELRFSAARAPNLGASQLLSRAHLAPPPPPPETLVLGPSASYPDFMFLCQKPQHLLELRAHKAPLVQCHSFTGPPYPPTGRLPDADTLRANFALTSKDTLSAGLVMNSAARPIKQARVRATRRRRASALLGATRRLLGFGRKNPRHAPVGYSLSNASTAENRNGSGERAGKQNSDSVSRMSPTSSLSTLIRKFNHDNYTSVCQQYEQRKQQIAIEQKSLANQRKQHEQQRASSADVKKAEVLIDGLDDGPRNNDGSNCGQRKLEASLIDEEGIFCRKGGLYYNYSLHDKPAIKCDSKARVNPLIVSKSNANCAKLRDEILLEVAPLQSTASKQTNSKAADEVEPNKVKLNQAAKKPPSAGEVQKLQQVDDPPVNLKQKADFQKEFLESMIEEEANRKDIGGSKRKKERFAVSSESTTSAKDNNETIISNITSVQELLDKMNGIMERQIDVGGGGGNGKKHDDNQSKLKGRKNKTILLEPLAKNNGKPQDAARQSDTCANQPKQSTATYVSQSSNNNNNPYDNFSSNTLDQLTCGTLDYASLRSIDDAMSLVSVSSEFEYHNINHGHQQQQRHSTAVSEPTGSNSNSSSSSNSTEAETGSQQRHQSDSSTSSSSSSSVEDRRLKDMRFPSFLPTKAQLAADDELRRPSASRVRPAADPQPSATPSRPKEADGPPHRAQMAGNLSGDRPQKSSFSAAFHAQKASSSLLNLTAAKFAALGNQQPQSQQQPAQIKQKQGSQSKLNQSKLNQPAQLGRLPQKTAGSSNTITKQRGRLLTLNEFASRNLDPECSLPAESGNVRARIRKMEQQSTPNLNSSQQAQQPVAPAKVTPMRLAPSASKLPVLANAQLARATPLKTTSQSQRHSDSTNPQQRQRTNLITRSNKQH